MSEILYESNRGIIFEKTNTKNRCKVIVKNKDGSYNHMIYRFRNGVKPLSSKYLSWKNLNCCGGWVCDDSYLLSAVQKSKKLCVNIYFNSKNDMLEYIKKLSDEYHYYCEPSRFSDFESHSLILTCKGSISDYIDIEKILNTYSKLGIDCFEPKILIKFLRTPMIKIMSGYKYDWANPESPEEIITTGLLLGYPLESTAWILERDFL